MNLSFFTSQHNTTHIILYYLVINVFVVEGNDCPTAFTAIIYTVYDVLVVNPVMITGVLFTPALINEPPFIENK